MYYIQESWQTRKNWPLTIWYFEAINIAKSRETYTPSFLPPEVSWQSAVAFSSTWPSRISKLRPYPYARYNSCSALFRIWIVRDATRKALKFFT